MSAAVGVAVAVTVGVGVAGAVTVAVAVAVGANDPLAQPVNLTLADGRPQVASLLIAMLAEKLEPLLVGANSTVTVKVPCGLINVAPCPEIILKNALPVGGATVTESALAPPFVMVKDFVSPAVLRERLILLKARLFVDSSSLLAAARAFVANEIAATAMNDANAARV